MLPPGARLIAGVFLVPPRAGLLCSSRLSATLLDAPRREGVFPVRKQATCLPSPHSPILESTRRDRLATCVRAWAGLGLCVGVACVLAADTYGEAAPGPAGTTAYEIGWDARGPVAFHTEFQFARLQHHSARDSAYRQRWLTDWPAAEQHLLRGVNRLTRIHAASESRLVSVMDEDLFDYPLLYVVEPGSWQFSNSEAVRLREYLLRGGFLLVDDFHGTSEWHGFVSGLRRVLPDRKIVDIPRSDSVFHTVYELEESVQIPGIGAALRGVTYERGGVTPHWRGIYDDQSRLMVVINFNMDLGDAWEHADVPEYALRYTNRAYKYAINYIVYAMTH